MKPKEVIQILNEWASNNNATPLSFKYMSGQDWGITRNLANLFKSKLQFTGTTYEVGNKGGFKYGLLTPYSYVLYKKAIKTIGDLSHERPDNKTEKKNRKARKRNGHSNDRA